ncbi:MAG TPA: alpha/beta hydrolase [Gemmatimonadaceae bacterium]
MHHLLPRSKQFPAGCAGLRARFVELASGFTVRVVECGGSGEQAGAAAGAGAGAGSRPVVLIGGWGSSAYLWRKNLLPLAAAGLRPIAVELPGQGQSDIPTDPAMYTSDALVRHAIQALDALALERAMLVGLSLGGAVAAGVALAAPKRVDRLALVSAVGLARARFVGIARLVPEALMPLVSRMGWRWVFAVVLRIAYGDLGRPTAADVDQYYAAAANRAFVPSLWSLIHRVQWGELPAEVLRRLTMPVLAIYGTRDRIVPPTGVDERIREIPNAELVLVEGAGHLCTEEAPEAVNRALVRFLAA